MKATIAFVRELGPYLNETDCELVEMTVFTATAIGLFVLFDVRE
ncbi:hypothetical protein [Mesorhizobium sp. M0816]